MGVNHPQFGTFCTICFQQLSPGKCVTDSDGLKWDVCKGKCATEAGIDEEQPPVLTAEERTPSEFPESTRAAIEANVQRWAARPIPDHIILRTRKIWNSVQ